MTGRDISFVGEEGAVLYSTVSPTRAHMLVVLGKFRSLTFRGLTWKRTAVPLTPTPGDRMEQMAYRL